jgi:hypothetical protein
MKDFHGQLVDYMHGDSYIKKTQIVHSSLSKFLTIHETLSVFHLVLPQSREDLTTPFPHNLRIYKEQKVMWYNFHMYIGNVEINYLCTYCLVIRSCLLQEFLQRTGGHIFRNEDKTCLITLHIIPKPVKFYDVWMLGKTNNFYLDICYIFV